MNKSKEYVRFALPVRIEHWVMVLSFVVLAITGLPQKFADDGWAETMIGLMGGIEITRVIHHTAAIVLLLGAVYHFVVLLYKVYVLRVRWTIFPQLQDVMDAINGVLYNAGFRKEAPRYDQFSWGEKFEYWALIWGTLIMGVTGFMLWNPIITSRFFPGEIIPAGKAAHGAEAILAVLSVLVWHFYNVHLRSFNKSMFTGKMSEHEMEEEHGLQLALLEQGKPGRTTDPLKIRRRQRIYLPIAAVASLALLFGVFLFTTAETTAVTTIQRQAGAIVTIYARQTATVTPVRGAQGTPASQPASGIPALPASHAGRTTCTACHDSGVAGAPKSPADHAGRLDNTCQDCHKPQGASAPATATTATTPTTAASSPTELPTAAAQTPTAATGGAIPSIPANHATAGCPACHSTGAAGAPKWPADHEGRADNTCQACHKPAAASAPVTAPTTAAPTTAPTATTAAAAPTATTASAGGTAPKIPANHATSGCSTCHTAGLMGAPVLPADHAGRTDDSCVACHKP
ncbi:MAG: cytochrome b/b6 domain-containing protein [Rudaea sp.]